MGNQWERHFLVSPSAQFLLVTSVSTRWAFSFRLTGLHSQVDLLLLSSRPRPHHHHNRIIHVGASSPLTSYLMASEATSATNTAEEYTPEVSSASPFHTRLTVSRPPEDLIPDHRARVTFLLDIDTRRSTSKRLPTKDPVTMPT